MIFFLAFPFLAPLLAMLFAAALTFAVSASFVPLRAYAITAPLWAFLVSPALILAISPLIYGRMFVMDPPVRSAAFLIRFGTGTILILIGCLLGAYLITVGCRAIFELLPAFLSRSLGIKPSVLLQASILSGGVLSCFVLLASFALLIYFAKDHVAIVLACGLLGLVTSGLCFRAVLRLANPECYQPKPMPQWARNIVFTQPQSRR